MIRRRIRSFLASLAVCVVATTTLSVAAASPAAAFGNETFGCRVSPGSVLTWNQFCRNSTPASVYNAGFAVLNTSGSYTYSWSISGPYQSVFVGCTSTSHDCAVWVDGSTDATVSVTVTYTQNGQSATRTARATIIPFCGNQFC